MVFACVRGGSLSLEKDEMVCAWTSREAVPAGSSRPGTDFVVTSLDCGTEPPAGSKDAESSARHASKQAPAPQKPEEKKPPEPAPGQIQLETPQAAQPPAQTRGAAATAPKLTNPTAPAAPPQEEHKPTIESIIFRGKRRIPASTLRARIFSHPGDVYDENALERDFMALWNTGFLDDVRLEVADAPNGNKIVTFYVREKKLVRSIDYKGLSSVAAVRRPRCFQEGEGRAYHRIPV